jgi:hypothetical protein
MPQKVSLDSGRDRSLNTRIGARRFVQEGFSLGTEQYFPWQKALAVADAIEDEELLKRLDASIAHR